MWTLVTGGGRGLGAVIADTLAHAGHRVLVHYRTSRPKGAHASLWGDFSSYEGIEQFIAALATDYPLSALVHNVGIYQTMDLVTATAADWHRLWVPNLVAPARLGSVLAAQKQPGAIVHLGVAGLNANRIIRLAPLYSVLKEALWALTRAQAKEWAGQQVRVNMVSPGQLEGSVDLRPQGPLDPKQLPMHRAACHEEVAGVVAQLLVHPYITGQNIEVAGGYAL